MLFVFYPLMKITFKIQYDTVWGQTLHIAGSLPELGAWNNACAKEMHCTEAGNWSLEIELPDAPVDFEYRYFLRSGASMIFEEWKKNHRLSIADATENYYVIDCRHNFPENIAFYSSAFAKCWFAHTPRKEQTNCREKIQIKVSAPAITGNQTLVIVGNQPGLGNWNPAQALVMGDVNFPEWSCQIPVGELCRTRPVEYKFCIIDKKDKSAVRWETGENRILSLPDPKKNETVIFSGLQFRDKGFEWKCAGTVIPVFSLRSEHSFGIGDFADLKAFVDWLSLTSRKILQILPVNDTTQTHTWMDSYPYSAISIYALHPVYLRLDGMGKLNGSERNVFYRKKQKELNALEAVDYEQVEQTKWAFFGEIFNQEGEKTLNSEEFGEFFNNNKEWLVPYASYSRLRDKIYSIELYYHLQFQFHLSEAKDYAHSKGIVLKGDIPVGISKTSNECFLPELFGDYIKEVCQMYLNRSSSRHFARKVVAACFVHRYAGLRRRFGYDSRMCSCGDEAIADFQPGNRKD